MMYEPANLMDCKKWLLAVANLSDNKTNCTLSSTLHKPWILDYEQLNIIRIKPTYNYNSAPQLCNM